MPLPKRRHSRMRQAKRRANWKVKLASLSTCPQCGKLKMPHRVCPHCGYYKGKPVVQVEAEEVKKKK